jgi:hypothetical protein
MKYFDIEHRRNICSTSGKVMFDKRGAQTKMNYLLKIGTERNLRIYPCPNCGGWHLSSNNSHHRK